MKIHPDQINALNKEQTKADPKKEADGKFGDVLAQEVQNSQATGSVVAGGLRPLQAPLMADALRAPEQAEHIPQGRAIMENLDSLLSEWENYAGKLSGAGLKEAYGVLDGIDAGVKELKARHPDMESTPELKSMVDEIEVMAATERIKFARGDYS
jgi:hypothetical protein